MLNELDGMTGWQYRVSEAESDLMFAIEVSLEMLVPPLFAAAVEFGRAVVLSLEAVYQAFQDAEDQERIKHAKNVTPRARKEAT